MSAHRLKLFRNELDISAQELARSVGVKTSTIYSYESGNSSPNLETLNLLYVSFGLNIHWFVTGDGTMFNEPKNTLNIKCEPLKIDKYELGQRVNKIRIAADLVSPQMAEMLVVSERELAAIISGEGKITLELVQKICENFDVTADWLLFGHE